MEHLGTENTAIEELTRLFAEQTVKEITLATNELPVINLQGEYKTLHEAGKLTNTTCEAFLKWLQQEIPDEVILPTQDKRLVVYTADSYRLVVNAMVEHHYIITIKKK